MNNRGLAAFDSWPSLASPFEPLSAPALLAWLIDALTVFRSIHWKNKHLDNALLSKQQ
jgi:hypothetical protein